MSMSASIETCFQSRISVPWSHVSERRSESAKIKTLPDSLRLSLTWDQGAEMRDWKHVSIDADIDIYFCDPHSPWQRGTNENTNGLLRQYFPKGTNLGVHSKI